MGKFSKKIKKEANDTSKRHAYTIDKGVYVKNRSDANFDIMDTKTMGSYHHRMMVANDFIKHSNVQDVIDDIKSLSELCNFLTNRPEFMELVHNSVTNLKIPIKDLKILIKGGGYFRIFTSSVMKDNAPPARKIQEIPSNLLYIQLFFSSDRYLLTEIRLSDLDSEIKFNPFIISNNGEDIDESRFDTVIYDILQIWCMIQVLYLHPIHKEVLYTREETESTGKHSHHKSSDKPHKLKPIKKIYVNKPVLESLMTKRHHNITCDCWYVMGHWRTYHKTGKRVWIEGYWKGENRNKEMPTNIRIREIPTDEVMKKYS